MDKDTHPSNPFMDPGLVSGYEALYETTGCRADRLEKALWARFLRGYPQAHTLLEIGCGTGHFTRWFAERGLYTAGIDVSPFMLQEAARRSDTSYVQGNALHLPFRGHSFDLVLMNTTLDFFPHPRHAVKEALRVARSGQLLGVLNKHSLLGCRLKKPAEIPWDAARLYTPNEHFKIIPESAGRRRVRIHWRIPLFPFLPCSLPLPWGGFIGVNVDMRRSIDGTLQVRQHQMTNTSIPRTTSTAGEE